MLYLHVIYTQINTADEQWGMLTFELPPMYWKFPSNDAYTTLRQSKIDWLSNTPSRVPQADWLMLVNNEKATFNIKMPF